MRFKPKTEEEVSGPELLPDGEYDFDVLAAEDQVSAAGNEMVKLKLDVFGPRGESRWVWDYLVAKEDSPYCERKIRHFAGTVGMMDDYESGGLDAAMLVGRSGRVQLVTSQDDGYSARNTVEDYVVPTDATDSAAFVKKAVEELNADIATATPSDDDIPF